jgi:hypothetical protein
MKKLSRTNVAPLKRTGVTLTKPINRKILRRPLLDFVPKAADPLAGVQPGKTQDVTFKRELDAVGQSFRDAAKKTTQTELHTHSGYGAEYSVIVFEDRDQVTAFFRAIGYPEPKDVFIDGTVVADILNIELPPLKAAPQKRLKAVPQS